MPDVSPHAHPDTRLQDAIRCANRHRFRAVHMRSLAELSAWPAVWLSEAARADDLADFVIEGMKDEGHG